MNEPEKIAEKESVMYRCLYQGCGWLVLDESAAADHARFLRHWAFEKVIHVLFTPVVEGPSPVNS